MSLLAIVISSPVIVHGHGGDIDGALKRSVALAIIVAVGGGVLMGLLMLARLT